MPTVVTRYLNTGSTAGGDGTTNATSGANRAWATLEEARAQLIAAYASLVASDVQIELEASGATDDTTVVTNTWPTSDATRYIHFKVPTADQKLIWDANVYTYGRGPNFAPALSFNTNSMRLTGVQLFHSGSLNVGGNDCVQITGASGGEHIHDGVKYFKTNNVGQYAVQILNTAGTYVFRNCVAGGVTFRFRGGIALGAGVSSTTVIAYNNTLQLTTATPALTGLLIVFTAGGSNKVARLKNNLLQNAATGITVTNSTTNDQATNHTNTTTDATFVDAANGNFRLTAADTVARNLGTDLSGVADWPFSIDADNVARPFGSAWDIGAHENLTAQGRVFAAFIG